MWKTRTFYTFLSIVTIIVLAAVTGTVRYFVRRAALALTAEGLSCKYFAHEKPQVDFSARTVVFSAEKSELLRSAKLDGKVTFHFPVKFFELPWNVNLKSVAVDGAMWELDLREKTLNGHPLQIVIDKILSAESPINGKIPDFISYGTLKLTNPEGKIRVSKMRSILKSSKNMRLLGVYAGDMKVNLLYKGENKQLVGQYQAQQSDFEFFRLSFGLPELFSMHGVGALSGQILYDFTKKKLEYIRGSAKFGMNSSIQGSIFSLYGSRDGMINWEYLNSENWHIELRNATSGKPFRTKLHNLVLSQNTMEPNALSFDGEIEFFPGSFRESFNLELDYRTSNIRHRLVGKWNMKDKSWELSRLDTGKGLPQVKIKWNDFNIAFQGRSFKLSGAGAQSDHFGFHYELEMANADWKDSRKNMVITSRAKFEGDCILSLAEDTLRPVATGKISCEMADGAFNNMRFMLKNAFLNFSPDKNGKNKYLFSVGKFSVGIPDLKSGIRFEMPLLEGESSMNKLYVSSPSINLKYGNSELSSNSSWTLERQQYGDEILFKAANLQGKIGKENLTVKNSEYEFKKNALQWFLHGKNTGVKLGNDRFSAKTFDIDFAGENSNDGALICQKITARPANWKFNTDFMRCNSLLSNFSVVFGRDKKWEKWNFDGGRITVNYGKKKYVLPDLKVNEDNRQQYSSGKFSFHSNECGADLNYSRPQNSRKLAVSHGLLYWNKDVFHDVTGNIDLLKENELFNINLNYDEYKRSDSGWKHGNLSGKMTLKNGFELTGFSGVDTNELTKIRFIAKNINGENEFEVKNFPASYIEKTLQIPKDSLNGFLDGKVAVKKGEFFNPFKIQTFYLKNNQIIRLRLGELQKYAQIGDSIEDKFACDALKDFFAKTLILDYQKLGKYNILNLKAVGKSTELLPYEYDVKEKRLKQSDISLFNSEVEVQMKYMK